MLTQFQRILRSSIAATSSSVDDITEMVISRQQEIENFRSRQHSDNMVILILPTLVALSLSNSNSTAAFTPITNALANAYEKWVWLECLNHEIASAIYDFSDKRFHSKGDKEETSDIQRDDSIELIRMKTVSKTESYIKSFSSVRKNCCIRWRTDHSYMTV